MKHSSESQSIFDAAEKKLQSENAMNSLVNQFPIRPPKAASMVPRWQRKKVELEACFLAALIKSAYIYTSHPYYEIENGRMSEW